MIAYKALPRPMFATLQHQTFPVYFVVSMGLSVSMLSLWTWTHPDVITHILYPQVADVAQAYALGMVLLSQGANYFVVGPLTSKYVVHAPSTDLRDIKYCAGLCSKDTNRRKRRAKVTMKLE